MGTREERQALGGHRMSRVGPSESRRLWDWQGGGGVQRQKENPGRSSAESGEPHSCSRTSALLLSSLLTSPTPPSPPHPSSDSSGAMQSLKNTVSLLLFKWIMKRSFPDCTLWDWCRQRWCRQRSYRHCSEADSSGPREGWAKPAASTWALEQAPDSRPGGQDSGSPPLPHSQPSSLRSRQHPFYPLTHKTLFLFFFQKSFLCSFDLS